MATATAPTTPKARLLLLPVAAFLVTLPLLLHGCSCGHDFDFHLQSWLEAANQFRHRALLPRWAFSPAWNSGEPRFVFYPPLSWLLGAIITMLFGLTAAPILFTWITLTAAAFTMYRLAREFASPNAALLAAALYIANPYMLFTAFERTAYGELLAAAWLPLLILAALREQPTIPSIAVPLALLWLTNAPAAVIGSYAFAAIIAIRLGLLLLRPQRIYLPPMGSADAPAPHPPTPVELVSRSIAGTGLGLALAAFYLLPAAYERRYVQIAMALIQNMRFQDNFLFGHTGDGPHDQVLHTASLIAVTILASTLVISGAPYLRRSRRMSGKPKLSLILITLTLLITLLLTPITTPLWNHLPELSFLQFPWRMIALQGVLLALAAALLLNRTRLPYLAATGTVVALTLTLTFTANHLYRQGCELFDGPAARADLFATHHGVDSTDEYTPGEADNDVLRWDNPAYWLADSPKAFAPNTIPNPAATIINYDQPHPMEQNVTDQAPMHFTVHANHPEYLILHLRDYPNWQVAEGCETCRFFKRLSHITRDDGLLAVALPTGDDTINITWHRSWDEELGSTLSVLAFVTLLVLSGISLRSRRLKTEQ